MTAAICELMRYGIEPLYFWNMEHLTEDGRLPPPVNPWRYRAFLMACAIELRRTDPGVAS